MVELLFVLPFGTLSQMAFAFLAIPTMPRGVAFYVIQTHHRALWSVSTTALLQNKLADYVPVYQIVIN